MSPEKREAYLERRRRAAAKWQKDPRYQRHKYLLDLSRHIHKLTGRDLQEIRNEIGIHPAGWRWLGIDYSKHEVEDDGL